MAIVLSCIFAACDKVGKKQVPVYKGMTISRSFARASAMTASDAENSDLQGEQGRVEGDYDKRDDDFDQNKPFEDPNAPSIENKANSTLDVVGAAESIYYADKNQDIFITIRLSNPDSYEILSFTLNGKKYSNYMFESGSDMENLVLKVNVGDVGGIVEYTIDAIKYVDGTEIKDVRMDGDRTVKAGVRASDQTYVNVTNEQKTMTSISFDAQVVDLYSLIEKSGGYAKAVLYDGVNMLTKDIEVGEKTNIVFDNLTPNTVYQYGVVALYDNLSGNGAKLNTLYKKAVHTDTIVLFKDVQVGKESIEWGFVWNESFANKQMSEISLWQNGAKVQDVDATAMRLDSLKSNNKYILKATYKNLQNQDETISIEFVTCAKATPSVTISNLSSTKNTIECDIAYTDVDIVGRIESVVLFKGETQVATTNERTHVVFDALEGDTEYTLVITYKYDLNDGKGEQTATQSAKRYTAPQFEFVEATCANTSAVSKGDVIYFEAKVNNPSGVVVDKIKINGRYYTPSGGTTKNSIIVNITVEDQFEGGNTALEVTEIQGTLRGQKVTIVPTQSNVANVFVNGELSVKSIQIVDEDGIECDMVVQNKQYYYLVSFNNKTGYSIDSIVIKCDYDTTTYLLANSDYTMQNTQTAKIPVMFTNGVNNISVSNVKYSNASLGEKSKEVVGVAVRAVCVTNEVPIGVTTAEQLKSMNDWRYYVLENDIDLAGTEWKDLANFSGYFDGQGYAIKNMNFVGTVENTEFNWGLFREATGVVKNLTLSGRLIVTMNRTNTTEYNAYVGGLCATADDLNIESVANNINLSITNNFDGHISAGGLVGRGTVTITGSYNTGDVSATGEYQPIAGGLVGSGETVTITNSYNTGNVSSTAGFDSWAYAGGLVGGYNVTTVTITDSYNTGEVSATSAYLGYYCYAGGLVGYGINYGTVITITDSYNTGSVSASAPGNSNVYAGGLVGCVVHREMVTITDCYYTLPENNSNNYGEKKDSVAEIVAIMENLWDSSVWDFDNLDENGNPILRY